MSKAGEQSKEQLVESIASKLNMEKDVIERANYSQSELQNMFRKAARAEFVDKKVLPVAILVFLPALFTSLLTNEDSQPLLHSVSTALAGISFAIGLVGGRIFDRGVLANKIFNRAAHQLLEQARASETAPNPAPAP